MLRLLYIEQSHLGIVSVGEFDANGTSLGVVTSSDPDLDGLTYSIQSGNTDGIFQVNPITGVITVLDNTNLNHETGASYNLVIRVTDDGSGNLFDETTVVVNVTDLNDAPVLPASGPFAIGENATDTDAVGSVPVSDADVPADTITYSIS